MSPFRNRCSEGLTRIELLAVILSIGAIALLLAPMIFRHFAKASRVNCTNNMKQVGLAFRIFSGDHNDAFPMEASVTNGGVAELLATVSAAQIFLTMTNELGAPKVLHCPADDRLPATGPGGPGFFGRLLNQNVSYFVGWDAKENSPQRILSGDRNLAINGSSVRAGFVSVVTNQVVSWTTALHSNAGNICFADGSVMPMRSSRLQECFEATGLTTNRLVVP